MEPLEIYNLGSFVYVVRELCVTNGVNTTSGQLRVGGRYIDVASRHVFAGTLLYRFDVVP